MSLNLNFACWKHSPLRIKLSWVSTRLSVLPLCDEGLWPQDTLWGSTVSSPWPSAEHLTSLDSASLPPCLDTLDSLAFFDTKCVFVGDFSNLDYGKTERDHQGWVPERRRQGKVTDRWGTGTIGKGELFSQIFTLKQWRLHEKWDLIGGRGGGGGHAGSASLSSLKTSKQFRSKPSQIMYMSSWAK